MKYWWHLLVWVAVAERLRRELNDRFAGKRYTEALRQDMVVFLHKELRDLSGGEW